jgi:flagella basal body P-ring formation protein FlgA
LYLLLVCALSTILLCLNVPPSIGKQPPSANNRSVWLCVTKIRKGEKIQKRMIVEKKISEAEFPNGGVEFSWLIVGNRPDHDLPPTKCIQESDFLDLPGINVPFVYTTKEIPAGSQFKKSDLKVVPNLYFARVPSFPPRPTNISAVVGKKARTSFKEGHELYNRDLVP